MLFPILLFLTSSLFCYGNTSPYLSTPFLDYISTNNQEHILSTKIELETPEELERSCANVLSGLAHLGQKCAFLGYVNSENKDICYLKCLKNFDFSSLVDYSQALCFITPDKTKYCSQTHLKIDPTIFHKIKLLHIHTSQLKNMVFLKEALEHAKKENAKISCDLGSASLVKYYKKEIINLLPQYIDIVFANEQEILELTQLPPQQACDFLATFCEVVVVTMGPSGSWLKSGSMKFYTPSLNTVKIKNAGVGNLFISGFLHGYLNNASLPQCSWIGSYITSKALEPYKKEINEDFWKEIVKGLESEKALCASTKCT